jgi:hypothetical protein
VTKGPWRVAWILAGLAAIAWGYAVLVLWLASRHPSDARVVTFRTADGEVVDTNEVSCHGAAVVVGEHIWQMCQPSHSDAGAWLGRFELRAGAATLHPLGSASEASIRGAALHPDGRLAIVMYRRVFLVDGGAVTAIGSGSDSVIYGIAWRGDALEIVYHRRVLVLPGGRGSGASREVPYPLTDAMREDVHFEAAYPTEQGWRFLFTRLVQPLPTTGPIPVDLIEIPEGQPPRTLATLQFGEPFAHRLDDDPTKGWARDVVDRTPSGMFSDEHDGYKLSGDGLVAPTAPPDGVDATYGFARDYELAPGAITAIRRARIRDNAVHVRGRWIAHDFEHYARLHDLATGASGPPITNVFWIMPGFKLLPATDGGMWMMGSLGSAYLHIDANLARTDHLAFGERLDRLTVFDRAKRNSDFDLTTRRRLAVPVTLFGFGVVVLALPVALVLRRRERFARPARLVLVGAAAAYLVARLFFWGAYADLVGRFFA